MKEIFNGQLSKDPSLYIYVPAVGDTTLAPEGQTGIYVLMPTAELKTTKIDWQDESIVARIKEIIYHKLATIEALENIKQHIVSETILHR